MRRVTSLGAACAACLAICESARSTSAFQAAPSGPRPAARAVQGELLDFRSGDGHAAYVDVLQTDGAPRRRRVLLDPACRFRAVSAEDGKLVNVTDPDFARPELLGPLFRQPAVRLTLNSAGIATQLETFAWVWVGVLLSAEAGVVTLRGGAEPLRANLVEDWGEWRAEQYPAPQFGKVTVRVSPATAYSISLDPVQAVSLARVRGCVVRIVPDALRRARYVDVFRFNGIAGFVGGSFEQFTVRDTPGRMVLRQDAGGRYQMPVTAEGSDVVKGIWTSPAVRHYDRRGFPRTYQGAIPDGASAAVWVDPATSLITHVFWQVE